MCTNSYRIPQPQEIENPQLKEMTTTATAVDDSYSKVNSEEEIIEEDTAKLTRSEKESLANISERAEESAVPSGSPSSSLFPPTEGDLDQSVKDVSNPTMASSKFRIFLGSGSEQPLVVPEDSVMSKFHKMDPNEYPNKFGCHIIYRTDIRIYSDAIYLLNEYPSIFVLRKWHEYQYK